MDNIQPLLGGMVLLRLELFGSYCCLRDGRREMESHIDESLWLVYITLGELLKPAELYQARRINTSEWL